MRNWREPGQGRRICAEIAFQGRATIATARGCILVHSATRGTQHICLTSLSPSVCVTWHTSREEPLTGNMIHEPQADDNDPPLMEGLLLHFSLDQDKGCGWSCLARSTTAFVFATAR